MSSKYYTTRYPLEPSENPTTGDKVDRFVLEIELGTGGMGAVWSAFDPHLQVDDQPGRVAIKFLQPGVTESGRDQFQKAFAQAFCLHHTNIAPVTELGCDKRFGPYQVMRFLPGQNLRDFNAMHKKKLSIETITSILRPVAAALDHAHRNKVVHCDVKPENIMVNCGARLKGPFSVEDITLIDFGLAECIRESVRVPPKSLHGTIQYFAPEQLAGHRPDSRVDQWAFAVVAWELLLGELPFQGSEKQIATAIRLGFPPDVPNGVRFNSSALQQALSKNPEHRFPSATALIEALFESMGPSSTSVIPPTRSTDNYEENLRRANELLSKRNRNSYGALAMLERIPQSGRRDILLNQARTYNSNLDTAELDLLSNLVEERDLEAIGNIRELKDLLTGEHDPKGLLTYLEKQVVRHSQWASKNGATVITPLVKKGAAVKEGARCVQFTLNNKPGVVVSPCDGIVRDLPETGEVMSDTTNRIEVSYLKGFVLEEALSYVDPVGHAAKEKLRTLNLKRKG